MSDRTMKVELAIQRELAYRRKVFMLQTAQDREHLLPLQAKAQSPDSSCNPSQSLDTMTKSSSLQSLEGTVTAKDCSLISLPPQPPKQDSEMVKYQEDKLFCKICQVPCSCRFNYREHIRGHKHKARVKELELGHEHGSEVANKRIWCTLCNIWCIDRDAYGQHLAGQKHLKVEFAKKNGGQTARTQKYCELCQIWCTDDTTFNMHLKGRSHVLKLQTMQSKKRARE